ncbi:MAG: insulinase family protein, partial [Bdellovibrio sp.]
YAFSVIGTEAEIRSVTVEECQAFQASYYGPNNMTLIIAGDFSVAQALPIIQSVLGSWAPTQVPALNISRPQKLQTAIDEVLVHPNAMPESMSWFFQAPAGRNTQANAALEIALEILGSGPNSILYKKLVDTQLATSISADSFIQNEMGVSIISVSKVKGVNEELIKAKLEESLQELIKGSFDPQLMKASLARSELAMGLSFEAPEKIANFLGNSIVSLGGSTKGLESYYSLFERNTEDIKKAALSFLNVQKSVLIRLRKGPGSVPNSGGSK